jgi:hypothetical protein
MRLIKGWRSFEGMHDLAVDQGKNGQELNPAHALSYDK